jgi:rSAM/selenodomain-associated transferase 2
VSGAEAAVLSIVMPVLDEAAGIVEHLAPLQPWRAAGVEVVVVDGGSVDRTVELATPLCDRVVPATRGRALQMNAGAAVARGRLMVFLHADTTLPDGARERLLALARGGPTWGRFDVRLAGRHPLLRVVAAAMNWRSRLTAVATGDQAMFVSRELFAKVGGFPAIPLMEDVALSKRLRRECAPVCLRERAVTSGRRWEQGGALRTVCLMWSLRLAYFLGVAPARLARWYRQAR